MTKIYLIAGEASVDFIGGQLIKNLKDLYKTEKRLELVGIGGRNMEEAGLAKSLFPMHKISLMGFVEIIPHIFTLLKLINNTAQDIINHSPDLLITIDSPGFTYRVAKKVRKHLPYLKMLHIVAPSVWAYKEGRAVKYAKLYNYLFALLPFELPYFQKVGLDCRYIGHPIVEQDYYSTHDKEALKKSLQIPITTKLLCITPGSRKGEIMRHMPIFTEAINIIAKRITNLEVVFVISNINHQTLIESYLQKAVFKYSFSQDKLKIFAVSDAALAKSGTNTLEIAASGTPMIVAYKLNIISYFLIRWLIKIPYVSIINIIAARDTIPGLRLNETDEFQGKLAQRTRVREHKPDPQNSLTHLKMTPGIIPEFIQFDCTKENIAAKLIELLTDSNRAAMQVNASISVLRDLGFKSPTSPSNVAARIIKTENWIGDG